MLPAKMPDTITPPRLVEVDGDEGAASRVGVHAMPEIGRIGIERDRKTAHLPLGPSPERHVAAERVADDRDLPTIRERDVERERKIVDRPLRLHRVVHADDEAAARGISASRVERNVRDDRRPRGRFKAAGPSI